MTSPDAPAFPLVLVSLSWASHAQGALSGASFSSASSLWMGWVIQAPSDWSAFRSALNDFAWPEPFSRDPSKIIPYGPQPKGFGLNAPMFSVSPSHPLPILSIGLDATLPFERGAFTEESERALWDALRLEAEPRLFELMSELSPLPLGIRPDDGPDDPRLFGSAAAAQWMSRRERDDLLSQIPPSGPRPHPSL